MDRKNTPTQTVETIRKSSRLEKIEQRMADLAKKKKAIQARENEKERKARTRRLIQIGAIAIKYLEYPLASFKTCQIYASKKSHAKRPQRGRRYAGGCHSGRTKTVLPS